MCATTYVWRHLVKATEVTTGLVESNGSLPPGGWLKVTCGLTGSTPASAPGPAICNEYERTLACLRLSRPRYTDRPRYIDTTVAAHI